MTRRTLILRTLATLATAGLVLGTSGCLNDPPEQSGVFATTDSGGSWKAVPDLTESGIRKPDVYPPLAVNAVGASRTDANTVVAGTDDELFISTNAGGDWESLTENLPSSTKAMTVQAIQFHPTNGDTFYVGGVSGGYGKILKTTDKGKTLQDVFTVSRPGQSVTTIALTADGGTIFAGDQLGSVFRSRDAGSTWERVFGIDGIPVTSIALSGPNVFVATMGQGIWRSPDSGASFAQVNGSLTGDNLTVWTLSSGLGGLYAGTDENIFVTRDFGASWQPVGNALPAGGARVQAIATSGSNLYYATNAVIYRANPDGGNFSPSQLKLATNVFSLSATGQAEKLYAGANAAGSDYSARYSQGLSGLNIGPPAN